MKTILILTLFVLVCGCVSSMSVPHEGDWGVYSLDLVSQEAELLYSTNDSVESLSVNGEMLAFSSNGEIYTFNVSSSVLNQLTDNGWLDTYPVFSPDGARIAFLSMNDTLDIMVVGGDGGNVSLLYDSGFHDADISWVGNKIAFTRNSQVWLMDDDGDNARSVTNFSLAEIWGNANLPFGDYDPRISPDGSKIVFERLWNDSSVHGNYDLFVVNVDGSNEARLTHTGYSQGLASWSPSGDKVAYVVAAINDSGVYDIYVVNSDGSDNHSVTPDYFPADFLCNSPVFVSESKLYFIGQWWS